MDKINLDFAYLNGVKCDAKNCIHNDMNCHCTAKEIKVDNPSAKKQDDTFCSSFCCEK